MAHPTEQLLSEIDVFLEKTGIPQSIFGRDAIGDPNLVRNLRRGRELRVGTAQRVRDFIAARMAAAEREVAA